MTELETDLKSIKTSIDLLETNHSESQEIRTATNYLFNLPLYLTFQSSKMKFSEIITLSAALATSASANPMKRSANVPDYADITFVAADNFFSQSFPTDGSVVDICKLNIFYEF